jgi:hypothetical protein
MATGAFERTGFDTVAIGPILEVINVGAKLLVYGWIPLKYMGIHALG